MKPSLCHSSPPPPHPCSLFSLPSSPCAILPLPFSHQAFPLPYLLCFLPFLSVVLHSSFILLGLIYPRPLCLFKLLNDLFLQVMWMQVKAPWWATSCTCWATSTSAQCTSMSRSRRRPGRPLSPTPGSWMKPARKGTGALEMFPGATLHTYLQNTCSHRTHASSLSVIVTKTKQKRNAAETESDLGGTVCDRRLAQSMMLLFFAEIN